MNKSVDAARQSMTTRFDFSNTLKTPSETAPVGQINEAGVGMEAIQRRVFVVAVNGDVLDALVFQVLDKIDGEETFADTAFAVEDEVETFHGF